MHKIHNYFFTNINQYKVSDWLLSLPKDPRFLVEDENSWLETKASIVQDISPEDKLLITSLTEPEFNACSVVSPLRIGDLNIPETIDMNKRILDISLEIKTQLFHPDDPNMKNYENPYRHLFDQINTQENK